MVSRDSVHFCGNTNGDTVGYKLISFSVIFLTDCPFLICELLFSLLLQELPGLGQGGRLLHLILDHPVGHVPGRHQPSHTVCHGLRHGCLCLPLAGQRVLPPPTLQDIEAVRLC